MQIFQFTVAYARIVNEEYLVPFQKIKFEGMGKDLEFADCITSASASTNDRYIRLSNLCLNKEYIIPFVEEPSNREPLKGNKTTSAYL